MIVAQKPADIIARELPEYELPDLVADDIIAALEDEGWYFVWAPDMEVKPTYGMRRLAA